MLRCEGGHFLGQHVALLRLFGAKGYKVVSYSHVDFDESLAPSEVTVLKVFNSDSCGEFIPHQVVTLGVKNQECLEQLRSIDTSNFAADDVLFLTSATAERVLAYGQWLREILPTFSGKVGIYNTVSSEVDDTVGRELRRGGVEISDESFTVLDNIASPNQQKRSMYRFLFDSIPSGRGRDVKVFYEEPFPGRGYLELCFDPEIEFVYLHSMYPGFLSVPNNTRGEKIRVAFLGSGGVSFEDKGRHLLPGIVNRFEDRNDVEFLIHLGVGSAHGEISVDDFSLPLTQHDNVSLKQGALGCASYCELIESSDVVVLPYGPRYRHIMSGVFDDCLFLGIPCVVPAQSKMALWLERHNISHCSFSCWDVEGVAIAMDKLLDEYDLYKAQFQKAREICRERWERLNPFSVLMGE